MCGVFWDLLEVVFAAFGYAYGYCCAVAIGRDFWFCAVDVV